MKLEETLGKLLIENHLTIATAESCTGGLLSSKLTDVSGSSEYIKLNFVTYANEAKNEILGVKRTRNCFIFSIANSILLAVCFIKATASLL